MAFQRQTLSRLRFMLNASQYGNTICPAQLTGALVDFSTAGASDLKLSHSDLSAQAVSPVCLRALHTFTVDLGRPAVGQGKAADRGDVQHRHHLLSISRRNHDLASQGGGIFVYKGPLSQAVKNLKRLSLAGCLASLVGGPLMVSGAGEAMPLAAQTSIIATIGGFGIFTTRRVTELKLFSHCSADRMKDSHCGGWVKTYNTLSGLLHWFTSPYVHTLEFDRQTGTARAETVSILGRSQWTTFHAGKATYPDTIRPQVGRKFFYLDADNFADKEILLKLTPEELRSASLEQSEEGDRKMQS